MLLQVHEETKLIYILDELRVLFSAILDLC